MNFFLLYKQKRQLRGQPISVLQPQRYSKMPLFSNTISSVEACLLKWKGNELHFPCNEQPWHCKVYFYPCLSTTLHCISILLLSLCFCCSKLVYMQLNRHFSFFWCGTKGSTALHRGLLLTDAHRILSTEEIIAQEFPLLYLSNEDIFKWPKIINLLIRFGNKHHWPNSQLFLGSNASSSMCL